MWETSQPGWVRSHLASSWITFSILTLQSIFGQFSIIINTFHITATYTCYWRKFLDWAIAFAVESNRSNSMVRPSLHHVVACRDVHLPLFRQWVESPVGGQPHCWGNRQAFSQPRDNPLPMSFPCSLERHICRSILGIIKYSQSKYLDASLDDKVDFIEKIIYHYWVKNSLFASAVKNIADLLKQALASHANASWYRLVPSL